MASKIISDAAQATAVSSATIAGVVDQIVDRFDPEKVILFGSYASGLAVAGVSDVDMLVVMETQLRETEQAVNICQSIDYHFGLDLIVRTPATLERRMRLGDPFMREILQQGIVLYERAARQIVREFGRSS